MFLHLLLLAVLMSYAPATASAEPADIRWEKSAHFTIKPEKQGGFKASAQFEFRQVFLTERSDDSRRFQIYEPSTSQISDIRAFANGVRRKDAYVWSEAADNRDVFLTDSRIHYLSIPGKFKPGDSLGYSYREEFEDINYLPIIYIPNQHETRRMRLTFSHPEGMTVNAEVFASRHNVSVRTDRTDPKQTVFTVDSLSALDPLPFFAFNEYHAAILLTVTFRDLPVSVSTPVDFLRWYGKHTELHPALDSISWHVLDTVVADTATDLEKLESIHDWVCGQIRYIADESQQHAIFPHRPSEVLSVRYGDCKDRASLVSALARRYGVDVRMGLVSSEFEPPFQGMHVWQFDHVVCVYTDGDSVIVFDPTARYHPFGSLPHEIIGHPVFVLDPDNPRWEMLRRYDTLPDAEIDIAGNLDSLASARGRVFVRGQQLARIRSIFATQVGAPKERVIAEVINAGLATISLSNFVSASEDRRSLTLTCDADLSRFVVSSSTNRYVPRTPFSQLSPKIQDRAQDTLPVYLDSLQHITLTLRLNATGRQLLADSTAFADSCGSRFTASARPGAADTVVIAYAMARREKVFQGDAKTSFLDFCKNHQLAASQVFTIKEAAK